MAQTHPSADGPSQTALAHRLARRCRQVVDDLLFGWEVADIEREFRDVILDELREANKERETERGAVISEKPADAAP